MDFRKKFMGNVGESYKKELAKMPAKWDYEADIADYAILPALGKLSSDEKLNGVKLFVETDAIFLNIRIENVPGYIWHERHNIPEDAEMGCRKLKKYFEESKYEATESEYGFFVILKP